LEEVGPHMDRGTLANLYAKDPIEELSFEMNRNMTNPSQNHQFKIKPTVTKTVCNFWYRIFHC